MSDYRLISVERAPRGKYVLTADVIPSRLTALFGARVRRVQFFGSGTAWHAMPSYRLVEPGEASRLARLMTEASATGLLCALRSGACSEPAEHTCRGRCGMRFCGAHLYGMFKCEECKRDGNV